jgi:hypothetical protein
MNEVARISTLSVEERIYFLRGQRVLLDADLARLYGVSTSALNQALKRNAGGFPLDFAFQLTRQEFTTLISQIVISNKGRGGRKKLPWVFTEHGAIMLSTVLNSAVAIEASVRVVRAFVHLREVLSGNKQLSAKFVELERRLDANDESIKTLFDAIRELLKPESTAESRREIGFHIKERSRKYSI